MTKALTKPELLVSTVDLLALKKQAEENLIEFKETLKKLCNKNNEIREIFKKETLK